MMTKLQGGFDALVENPQRVRRTPEIERVWIYGSRATGLARPDSGLDVAVDLAAVAGKRPVAIWTLKAPAWRDELAALLPDVRVTLERLAEDGTIVTEAVSREGILIFDRMASTVTGSAG